jgi:hypothetical protein
MSESIKPKEQIEVSGREILDQIRELNEKGKHVIFAPNHVLPQQKWRADMALATDYPVLHAFLKDHGIDSFPIRRNDLDAEVGDSRIRKTIYRGHKEVFDLLGKIYAGGVGFAINNKEPYLAVRENMKATKTLIKKTEEGNPILYPYGKWYETGSQQFTDNIALDGDSFVPLVDTPDEYERWRNSLKGGAFKLSRITRAPIVPVYVEQKGDQWIIRFGSMIDPPQDKNSTVKTAQKYLEAMRSLQKSGIKEA